MSISLHTIHTPSGTCAVVPARQLSWHQVQLPVGSLRSPRLRAILDGLLEDVVLDEPASLHFALAPDAKAQQKVWVAVCDKAWLRNAMQALQTSGQTVARVVPEFSPTSGEADRIWMTGNEQCAQLAWADAQGVHRLPVVAGQTLPAHLPATLADTAEVVAEPAVSQWAEQLFHRNVVVMTAQERWQVSAQSDWNLAQFDMTRNSASLGRASAGLFDLWQAPQWRAARWVAGILMAAQLVGLNAYAWRARQVLADQRSTILSTFTTTFPQVTVVVDAPLQMEREVATLRQSSGNTSARDLEALLSAYGTYAPAALINSAPAAIEYVAGELRMSGPAWDPAEVTSFNSTLQAPGFGARLDGSALVITLRSAP